MRFAYSPYCALEVIPAKAGIYETMCVVAPGLPLVQEYRTKISTSYGRLVAKLKVLED